jgi:acyl-lipid omega-6 desaturase (Delta-12 desaturase)
MAPRLGSALFDLATSIVAYLALTALMVVASRFSYLLVLVLALPAAGFLVRTFIVFHDCAHGSFTRSKRANALLGGVLGIFLFTPFAWWRHKHAVHHATAGDLDRRGVGDVQTITVEEYRGRPWWGRLAYRLFRNPLVMFGLGPLYAMLIHPRFVSRRARPRVRRSVLGTDVALLAGVALLGALVGWRELLLVQALPVLLAGSMGVFLFYVQHQFEGTYWQQAPEWSFADAALRGSSYLKLPRALQFFTASIGLHHVHHLSASVPNYNLQRAHDANPIFHKVPTLSLWDGVRAVRLKLWDPERGRLVTFGEARAQPLEIQPAAFSNTSR